MNCLIQGLYEPELRGASRPRRGPMPQWLIAARAWQTCLVRPRRGRSFLVKPRGACYPYAAEAVVAGFRSPAVSVNHCVDQVGKLFYLLLDGFFFSHGGYSSILFSLPFCYLLVVLTQAKDNIDNGVGLKFRIILAWSIWLSQYGLIDTAQLIQLT